MDNEGRRIAALLRRFVSGDVTDYEWDDLISSQSKDPVVERYRLELAKIPYVFPAKKASHYTSQEGIDRILEIAGELEGLR